MLNVVCLKWGTAFPAIHVNVLNRAVRRHLSVPYRFVCLTDDGAGIDSDVNVLPLPDMQLSSDRQAYGCWQKLAIFKRGLFPEGDTVLYLDLDVLVQGPLDPFAERVRAGRGLHAQREWNPALWMLLPLAMRPDRGVQGAFLGFMPEDCHYIYEDFMADKGKAFAIAADDQLYLTRVAKDRSYWPDEWTVSFKRSCLWYYPFSLAFRRIKRPKRAKVILFHGLPRPWDLIQSPGVRWGTRRKFGDQPVEWVRDYYRAVGIAVD